MNTPTNEAKRFTLALTLNEAILVRDSLIDMKQQLKHSPSERGQQLCGIASDLAKQLQANIQ